MCVNAYKLICIILTPQKVYLGLGNVIVHNDSYSLSDTTESVFGSGKCEITYEPRIHSKPNVERCQEDDVTVSDYNHDNVKLKNSLF